MSVSPIWFINLNPMQFRHMVEYLSELNKLILNYTWMERKCDTSDLKYATCKIKTTTTTTKNKNKTANRYFY